MRVRLPQIHERRLTHHRGVAMDLRFLASAHDPHEADQPEKRPRPTGEGASAFRDVNGHRFLVVPTVADVNQVKIQLCRTKMTPTIQGVMSREFFRRL